MNMTINYNGTMEDWSKIEKHEKWAYSYEDPTDVDGVWCEGSYKSPIIVCTDGTISGHEHKFDAIVQNEYYHYYKCACDERQQGQSKHSYNTSDVCTDCGFSWVRIASSGLSYSLKDDGTYEVTGKGSCTDSKIVIPRHHEGKAVTSIGNEAFYSIDSDLTIKEMLIPEGVSHIGRGAFYDCVSLTSITLPSSINKVSGNFFGQNFSLTNITLIDGIEGISAESFSKLQNLETITIPKSLKTLGSFTFGACNVTIQYKGSVADWERIVKYADWYMINLGANSKYACPTIVCTDGTIKEHRYDDVGYHADGYCHWTNECDCGLRDYSTQTLHSGGKGNAHDFAACAICGEQYRIHPWAEKPTSSGEYHYFKCTVAGCPVIGDDGEHTYLDTWDKNGTSHWKACTICGYKANEEGHHGGTATCTEKAVCEDCGTAYGDLLLHYGEATCVKQGACVNCGEIYYDTHHYSALWSSNGEKHWHACGVCNAAEKDEAAHTPASTYTSDEDSHWYACTVCGSKTNEEEHSYQNGKCTKCGEDEFSSSGPIVIPGPGGGGGGLVMDPERDCGHKYSEVRSADHTKCAGCEAYRCDGQDHGLCKHCGEYICKDGHTTITYTWAEDNASCTAKRICTQTQKTVEIEQIIAEKTVTQQLSCTDDEISTLAADFTHPTFAKQEKTGIKTADMTGHSYDDDADSTCNTCEAIRTLKPTITFITVISDITSNLPNEGGKPAIDLPSITITSPANDLVEVNHENCYWVQRTGGVNEAIYPFGDETTYAVGNNYYCYINFFADPSQVNMTEGYTLTVNFDGIEYNNVEVWKSGDGNYYAGVYVGPFTAIHTAISHHDAVAATCTVTGTIEYWSCSDCNRKFGDASCSNPIEGVTTGKNPANHTGTKELKRDADGHWNEWSCCHAIDGTKAAHSYKNATDTTCNCGYVRTLAHTHSFGTNWEKDATHHWHECDCGDKSDTATHTAGPAATETTAQECTECGYELSPRLTHAPMLIEGYGATNTAPGKKDYYHCDSCNKNYEDAMGNVEITGNVEEWRYIQMIIAIVEGDGSEWTKGTNADLTFKSNANFTNFTRVEVDNVEVAPENYTVKKGSTIVILKATYLETLSVGKHTLNIVSATGTADTTFTIKAAADGNNGGATTGTETNQNTGVLDDVPQTVDNRNMFMWIVLAIASGLGIISTALYGRKKKSKK